MTAIFFDLDGTLTDPKEGITKSIQFALKKMGKKVPDTEELLWCIGPPLRNSFAELLGEESRVEEAISLYRERFSEVGLYENTLYRGITDLLAELKRNNFILYVATSKPHIYATKIIQHFELDQYFEEIFGSEIDGARSDKSELLSYALSKVGCDPRNSYMVGDRKHDAIGAINNNMMPVGVLYGYGSKEELEEAGVHQFAEKTPREILKLVQVSF
ncbi:HAD family hydrolase [Rhodospirillales bacterium 47_12_T64]|nr:HAD family hydrolase [Rhodospirillales bacterium 47_12_T64]